MVNYLNLTYNINYIMSQTIIAEYIWLDAEQNFRSKIKILTPDIFELKEYLMVPKSLNLFPQWNFDGSSTAQSETHNSDLILNPVYCCINPFYKQIDKNQQKIYLFVLCEVLNSDLTPHSTNTHHILKQNEFAEDETIWFGIEQEYMMFSSNSKQLYCSDEFIGKEKHNKYYCGVGASRVFGREIAEKHMNLCLDAGLKICGINAEVTPSQWEFQLGPLPPMEMANQLWLARYILTIMCEDYDVEINFHPKPFADLNGSGAHTNFSTEAMREEGGMEKILEAIEKLKLKHDVDIKSYGVDNELRLTGKNETSSYDKFTFGNSDRGSSIRIPLNVQLEGKGYFEDRRPASNMDPYLVINSMLTTIMN